MHLALWRRPSESLDDSLMMCGIIFTLPFVQIRFRINVIDKIIFCTQCGQVPEALWDSVPGTNNSAHYRAGQARRDNLCPYRKLCFSLESCVQKLHKYPCRFQTYNINHAIILDHVKQKPKYPWRCNIFNAHFYAPSRSNRLN